MQYLLKNDISLQKPLESRIKKNEEAKIMKDKLIMFLSVFLDGLLVLFMQLFWLGLWIGLYPFHFMFLRTWSKHLEPKLLKIVFELCWNFTPLSVLFFNLLLHIFLNSKWNIVVCPHQLLAALEAARFSSLEVFI